MASEPDNTPAVSWKTRYDEQRIALKAARHQVLQPAALRALLAARLRTIQSRAHQPTPEERERLFKVTSRSYNDDAIGAGEPFSSGDIEGVRWHVPVTATERVSEEWAHLQLRFPYQAILQTRDVGIGGVMLDIGANVGRMSIPRVILGDATAAYCAEADPSNYACLRRNVIDNGLNGLVMPDQIAIGDRDGVVMLERSGKHTGHHVRTGPMPRTLSERYVEVPACTLDSWVTRHQIDLDAVTFIKVDVEGYEQQVLDGATRVLGRTHIAWQLEVWASRLAAAGRGVKGLAETLASHFTHFIDLRRSVAGTRIRPISDIVATAEDLDRENGKTDILVFHAS